MSSDPTPSGSAQPQPATTTPSGGYPLASPPPGSVPVPDPRSRVSLPWLAIGLVGVLLGTIAVSVPLFASRFATLDTLDRQVETLDGDVAAHDRARRRARENLVKRFAAEDSPGKLATVRKADKAVDAAFQTWYTNGNLTFQVVTTAAYSCYGAVEAYNVAAAGYPEELFGDRFPRRISFSDPRTDCAVPGLRDL